MQQLKQPQESPGYPAWSAYALDKINRIVQGAITAGSSKIFIHTNLKLGLPLENINKVAGPFVEAWAVETFQAIADTPDNDVGLVNVQSGARLDPYDIILQFRYRQEIVSVYVDVKATAQDIATSGKSPNITSYGRIRTEYVNNPDYLFVVLSLKHKVYSEKIPETGMTNGVMEVGACNAFDLKYVSAKDISYNPALGVGQIQIRDINYASKEARTAQEFCALLDKKYIASKGEAAFTATAAKYGWLQGTSASGGPADALL
jgi:hypothetical protein